jgi:hypothetical protein
VHPLASVAEIGIYCKQAGEATQTQKQELNRNLMEHLAEQRAIAIKIAFAKRQRVGPSFTKLEHDAAMQEFRNSRLSGGNTIDIGEVIHRLQRSILLKRKCACMWGEVAKNDLVSICEEMEHSSVYRCRVLMSMAHLGLSETRCPQIHGTGTVSTHWHSSVTVQ